MTERADDARIFRIDIEPVGRRISITEGQTLLEAAQAAGVELAAVCGGVGVCGKCRIRQMTGELSALTEVERQSLSVEQIADGYRLACQCRPQSDLKIDVPPESLVSAQRLQVEGLESETSPDPVVRTVQVVLDPPSLDDLRADFTRLQDALAKLGVAGPRLDLPVLQRLSEQLRAQDWKSSVALDENEIVAVLPSGVAPLGLAVDIGTTKVAAYLVDLENGATLAKAGAANPQVAYGEDVLSRIAYANEHDEGRKVLQAVLVARLNQLIADLCDQAAVSHEQIVSAVLVGNTAMHHLLAGLGVQQLGLVPYVPAVTDGLTLAAYQLGLHLAPGSPVYLPPNIAGFVGSDHVSMLVAIDLLVDRRKLVAIDVGTNTEVSLLADGRLLSCSCASGPAFEGAHVRDGMRALPGAIERVKIQDGQVLVQTVENKAPVGVCGSGILDAVAELYRTGGLDRSGRMYCLDSAANRGERCNEFVLSTATESGHGQAVSVTQEDVREIQLAKGAIRTGIDTLLEEAGVGYADIDEFLIAGAFGTYLDLENVARIGMFPPLPADRFKQVGNAAGMGAKMMLISKAKRQEAAQIAKRAEYVELTTHPDFTRSFAHAMRF